MIKTLPACGICAGLLEGPQLRKCVGLGPSMLFYGLTREQIDPALEYLGESRLAAKLDLRVWCPDCARRVLEGAPAARARGGDCALCLDRIRAHPEDVGLLLEPGCHVDIPGQAPKPLCLNCRIHVFYKEGRL